METVQTDVLVIGGGGAGARAVVAASDSGASVVLVSKARFGLGGASALPSWGGGFNIPNGDADPSDGPQEEYNDVMEAAAGMCDEKLAHILAFETGDRLKELEDWGLTNIIRDKNGKYTQIRACFSSRPRLIKTSGLGLAPSIVSVLKKQMEKRSNIRVVDNVMITCLLIQKGACVGAIGVNRKGEIIVFKAKSTILASGGAAAMFPSAIYPDDITGDGYSLGYQAGAELANMEFIQIGLKGWHMTLLYLNPDIYNGSGQKFLGRYLPAGTTVEDCFNERLTHGPFSTRGPGKYLDIAYYTELAEGRGKVYMDCTRVTNADLQKAVEATRNGAFGGLDTGIKRLGASKVNILEKPLEITPYAHAFNGGFWINENAETTLPGLYAAGECATGPHGADRLGGNMVSACQVFGARAGKAAAARARNMGEVVVDEGQAKHSSMLVSKLSESRTGLRPREIEAKIREAMWHGCPTVRTRKGLETCLSELGRIRAEELPRMAISENAELFRALAIPNMLDVGQIVAESALKREESRGGHYRADFPERNDKSWAKVIKIRR